MAYVLQITSGEEVREVEFLTLPIFANVDSAIRSFSAEAAKYADEDGDLCTLTESTFGDFLVTAQREQGKNTVLRVELPVNQLNRPGGNNGCLLSTSPSRCSSIAGDWMLVDPEDARDPGDSGMEQTSDIQEDTGLSPRSESSVVEGTLDQESAPECSMSQDVISEDERRLDDSTSTLSGTGPLAVSLDTEAHGNDNSFFRQLVLKLGYSTAQTSATELKCGSAEPIKTDMTGTSSASDDKPVDSNKNCGPSCEALGQTAGQPIVDGAETEEQADPATGLASNALHSCSCKVCCNPLSMYLQSPFEYWACDLCDRSFLRSDPMWACQTAKECDWGVCKDCYDHLEDNSEARGDAETPEPCQPQTASNVFPPLLAGAIGAAALIVPPVLSVPLLFAATRHHGWPLRRF